MREGLILGDLGGASVVHGVHGTDGESRWKCLARRAALHGAWEAVEWAWLPPGGVSGEHVHTRTEEIYFIVSGAGRMTINDEPHSVGPGHLILTGLGTKHGLRNVGADGLGWLVIELSSPATERALRGAARASVEEPRATQGRKARMPAVIVNLREERTVDPARVFTGPARSIELVSLGPGEPAQLVSAGMEHTLFVLDGSGEALSGGARVALGAGISITLPLGRELALTAGPLGLEYFLASLDVPRGGDA